MQSRWRELVIVAAVLTVISVILVGYSPDRQVGHILAMMIGVVVLWHIAGYLVSYWCQTERYYDLVGALSHISVLWFGLYQAKQLTIPAIAVAVMVSLWAGRLGYYLYRRVCRLGHDQRFAEIKQRADVFLLAWLLSALWVIIGDLPAWLLVLVAPTAVQQTWIGILVWTIGWVIEVVADEQKRCFRDNPAHASLPMTSGLWRYCQHPNYAGEVILWVGVAIMAWPIMTGVWYLALMSPIQVYMLLRYVSGIPMLQEAHTKKYGNNISYQRYCATTPLLWPSITRLIRRDG